MPDLPQSNYQLHLALAERLPHKFSHAFGIQEVRAQSLHKCDLLDPTGSTLNNGRTSYSLCTSFNLIKIFRTAAS
jgi:hypothetical protein